MSKNTKNKTTSDNRQLVERIEKIEEMVDRLMFQTDLLVWDADYIRDKLDEQCALLEKLMDK